MTGGDPRNLRTIVATRGFRRLMGVRLSSQFTDGVFQASLAGSVMFNPDRQTGPLVIAAGSAVLLLPYSLIGPYAGVLLDRWSRRSVMVATNLLRALLMLPVALLIRDGQQGALFAGTAFVIIGLNRFFLAGLSAALPHVVDDRRLVTANAVSGTLGSIAYTLGLGTVVALLQTVWSTTDHGYAAVAAIAPVGCLVSALLARRSFTVDALGPDTVSRRGATVVSALSDVGRGMADGLRHLASRRGAAYAVAAQAAFRALFGMLALSTLLLFRNYFTTGDDVQDSVSSLAFVFAAGSAGVLLSAFITPPVTRRIGGWRWVATLLATVAVAVLAFGLPFAAPLLVIAVFVVNIASQGIKIVVDTAVQHECADAYRGRVFSVNDTAFNLAYVVGMFAAALSVPADGHSPSLLVAVAFCYAAVAVWYAVAAGRWAEQAGDHIAPAPGEPATAAPAGR